MKICFGGDVFLGGDLSIYPSDKTLINSDAFNQADVRVVNLENPITNSKFISDKSTLFAGPESIKWLSELNINVVGLANNHVHDKGAQGLNDTLNLLKGQDIACFGAGQNILKSAEPCELDKNLFVLGYCEYEKNYLKDVKVSDKDSWGVNPLNYETILNDLNQLADGQQAILFMHWGEEHLWLPPKHIVALSKKLLDHSRVAGVIGMHSHCIQGRMKHNNKYAYLGIGNFLFPNFYLKPKVTVVPTKNLHGRSARWTTKQYLDVNELTYKKWYWKNRLSVLVEYDSEKKKFEHIFVKQKFNKPEVFELFGFELYLAKTIFFLCEISYYLPLIIYNCVQIFLATVTRFLWNIKKFFFQSKQFGFMFIVKRKTKTAISIFKNLYKKFKK